MSIFDLFFLLAMVSTLAALLTAAGMAIRKRWARAGKIALGWLVGAILYVGVGLCVSYFRPQSLVRVGEPRCFDDWCMTIDKIEHTSISSQFSYQVHFRIFSRAARISQRAKGAWIYLIDENGRKYAPESDPAAVPLDVLLQPEQSIEATREFRVPSEARIAGVITGHGGDYCGAMSVLIMGDGGCWFNKPAMVPIR